MIRTIRLLIFLLLLDYMSPLSAEIINNGSMNNLTVEDGLGGLSVSDIAQDAYGQTWLATSNGISMFNGRQIYNYGASEGDISNYCFCITIDEKGNVYGATKKGVLVISPQKGFIRLHLPISGIESILAAGGKIYLGNHDGLHIYKNGRIQTIYNKRLKDNTIRCIRKAKDGSVWFTVRYHLCHLDVKTNHVTYIPMNVQSALSCFDLCGDNIFVGTRGEGILLYNMRTGERKFLDKENKIVSNVHKSYGDKICVSSDGGGAFLYEGHSGHLITSYNVRNQGLTQIPSNAVYAYYRDARGVDWLGLYRSGICYTFFSSPLFKCYSYQGFSTRNLNVSSFLVDGAKKIVGTRTGLYFVDESRNVIKYFSPEELGANIIFDIKKVGDVYYVSTYDGGLFLLNPRTLTMNHVQGNDFFNFSTFCTLYRDSYDRLWAASGEGLFIIDRKGRIIHYTENNSKLYGSVLSSMVADKFGMLWTSATKGVNVIDMKTLSIQDSTSRMYRLKGIPSAIRFFSGHEGSVMGHDNESIYVFDRFARHIRKINIPRIILGEQWSNCFDDLHGHYWIATEKGLFSLSYDMKSLRKYGYESGMDSPFIASKGIDSDENGNIWVASSKGLMFLEKSKQEVSPEKKNFMILPYNIFVNANNLLPEQEFTTVAYRKFRITWNFVSQRLSFNVICNDYARSNARLYEYKMDGELTWHFITDVNPITIINLFPGNHYITLRLAGLSNTETRYTIRVLPSWPFYVEMIILVCVIWGMFLFLRYRHRTNALLAERNSIESALIEEEEARQNKESEQDATVDVNIEKKKPKMNVDEQKQLCERITQYMSEHQPYLDPELKISDLASAMDVSQSVLSNMFKYYMESNYYDFVNSFRLKEFKHRIEMHEQKKYTILSISEQCGFKKTSFFTTFRKMEGMTPTEYIQKL